MSAIDLVFAVSWLKEYRCVMKSNFNLNHFGTKGIIRIPDHIILKQLCQQPGREEVLVVTMMQQSSCLFLLIIRKWSVFRRKTCFRKKTRCGDYDSRWKAEAVEEWFHWVVFYHLDNSTTLMVFNFCKLFCKLIYR